MRLIPFNVSVVDADLDKHPLSLSLTGGAVGRKCGAVEARLNYFILRREPQRDALLSWLVNPKMKKKIIPKTCLPTRIRWRFFKSVTWYSPQSRISPSCPVYPGCHTQAAVLNCRESVYLSNRITRKE